MQITGELPKAMSHPDVKRPDNETLATMAYELIEAIERCGASPNLTHAVSLAADLHTALMKPFPVPEPSELARMYPHYHKSVAHLLSIDFYRFADLFNITDQAVGHAIKKLMAAGERGAKDQRQDITEARDTLNRKLQMMDEDAEVASF